MRERWRWLFPVVDEPRRTKRPYRDTAIFHLVLAALIVVVAFATGGGLLRALVFALVFFFAATAWSWWRWRERLAAERRAR